MVETIQRAGALAVLAGVSATFAVCDAVARTLTPADRERETTARYEVVSAFARWLDATNAKDLKAQSAFYPQTMDAFYLWRQTPRREVLAEKRRVFAKAQAVEIRTEAPQVVIDANGRKARMYFRKAYSIRGPEVNRRGEVLQELIWAKQADGWKITSERDLLVLR